MIRAILSDAAFGSDPGRWPLPTAKTPGELWLRAVAAGGQGRYSCARAELAELLRSESTGPLASLAQSTRGSLLRQLGCHVAARACDGRALALADGNTEAATDALIGLAADALGVGRFAASAALLGRAQTVLAAGLISSPPPPHRLAVRLAWVRAELAMSVGEGTQAVRYAERAVNLALVADPVSARHRVKSDVVLAAALCSAGVIERARVVADTALESTGRLGLVPLRWALASLLVDIGSAAHTTPDVLAIRDACVDEVHRGGGRW